MMLTDKKDPFSDSNEFPAAGPSSAHPSSNIPLVFQGQDIDSLPNDALDAVPKYTEHALEDVYMPAGGEEPPPEFAAYEAEFFISGRDIVSHDPHLNQDGKSVHCACLYKSSLHIAYLGSHRGSAVPISAVEIADSSRVPSPCARHAHRTQDTHGVPQRRERSIPGSHRKLHGNGHRHVGAEHVRTARS